MIVAKHRQRLPERRVAFAILEQAASEAAITIDVLLAVPSRKKNAVAARRRAIERLGAAGYTVTQIGRILKRDHATIYRYATPRKPQTERDHASY